MGWMLRTILTGLPLAVLGAASGVAADEKPVRIETGYIAFVMAVQNQLYIVFFKSTI